MLQTFREEMVKNWSTLGLRVRKLDMSYAYHAQQRQLRSLWLGRMVGAA